MRTAKLGTISGLIAVLVAVSSCAPQPLPAPPPEQATLDPGGVATTVAQTAVVAQAQTIAALPPTPTPAEPTATATQTRVPTQTPTFTPTVLFLFQTETLDPALLAEPTTQEIYIAGSEGEDGGEDASEEDEKRRYPTPAVDWKCEIVSKSPPKGTVISPRTEFKVRWVVKNTGLRTWPKKGVDVVFKTGGRFHDRAYFDIPKSVPPGGTVTIEITLTTDYRKDTFTTYWALRVGKNDFCVLPITFEVR